MLRERRLEAYFTGIHGSPPAKAQVLERIMRDAGVEAENALMVGDAVTDRDAAEHVGALFYGVGQELKGGPFPWGADLTGLNDWIRARV